MDRARNCRRSRASADCRADFAPPCREAGQKGFLQPHRVRGWLNRSDDQQFDTKVTDLCQLYREAPVLADLGEVIYSTDELTGVQALERKYADQEAAPGQSKRREFEYIRHGT